MTSSCISRLTSSRTIFRTQTIASLPDTISYRKGVSRLTHLTKSLERTRAGHAGCQCRRAGPPASLSFVVRRYTRQPTADRPYCFVLFSEPGFSSTNSSPKFPTLQHTGHPHPVLSSFNRADRHTAANMRQKRDRARISLARSV